MNPDPDPESSLITPPAAGQAPVPFQRRKRGESILRGFLNRILQELARKVPGARTLRVRLHRWRGVSIGEGVWIGYDAVIETSKPHLVVIKDRASVGLRCTIMAHLREVQGVVIEEGADIGTGAIILPGVTIGRGAVVTAGSVVTRSVPPMTLVQGNPAVPIATVGIPLRTNVTLRQWMKHLRPLRRGPAPGK